MRQKELAVGVRVNQSYLCGVERGRRGTPTPEVVDRLAAVLARQIGECEAGELRWAAEHDRVVQELPSRGFAHVAPLISAALLAGRRLSSQELAGLLADMRFAIRSREHLDRLASGAIVIDKREVQPM